ncbi:MAG TPA: N-formylglutamate amidohydrolase [Kiloniellaceae bacterium]|nr:N-formylglutamate amidohydrolase [Kiloniellaceae bacterium]
MADAKLLAADEPAPLAFENEAGSSPFFLICEHASKSIPRQLGDLGLPAGERQRHIAWDIGALSVARLLARQLDAPLAYQNYSRLVCDCNRPISAPDFMPTVSETTAVPGNRDLGAVARRQRIDEIYRPFHDGVAAVLDDRVAAGLPTVVISVHSFTPVFKGVSRPWHCGVLTIADPSYAPRTLELLRREDALAVGHNEPYSMSHDSDYTIPVHGEARGLPSVEIEIRQDLIGEDAGQQAWAKRLAAVFSTALEAL